MRREAFLIYHNLAANSMLGGTWENGVTSRVILDQHVSHLQESGVLFHNFFSTGNQRHLFGKAIVAAVSFPNMIKGWLIDD